MFTTRTVNENGLKQIQEFLKIHHFKGNDLSRAHICAWAMMAEESMDNGNPPMIEVRAWDSMLRVPTTLTITDEGIDTEQHDES